MKRYRSPHPYYRKGQYYRRDDIITVPDDYEPPAYWVPVDDDVQPTKAHIKAAPDAEPRTMHEATHRRGKKPVGA